MSKTITAVRPVVVNVNDKTGLIVTDQIMRPAFFKGVDASSVDIPKGLRAVLPEGIGDDERITFRMFHSGIDTCVAGIGGRVTFASFVQSLAALATASAYGQNLEVHYSRLPAYAEYALKLAQTYTGKTESLPLSKLVDVMKRVVSELFALPVVERKPRAVAAPAVAAPAVAAPAVVEPGVNGVHSLAYGHEAHEDTIRTTDVDRMFAPMLDDAIKLTQVKADALARVEAESKDIEFASAFAAITVNRPEYAEQLLRAMAARLGYTLVAFDMAKAA